MLEHRTSNLTGLLLPLADRNLILPNVAVAELIDYQPSAFDLDTPPWYLGRVTWRNRQIPLLSFESACGQKIVIGERARIVILNALGGRPDLKFIALAGAGDSAVLQA